MLKGQSQLEKPGVEDVLVLLELRRPAEGADQRLLASYHVLAAVRAMPEGDPVAPPELPADAPVADVREPIFVSVLPPLREEPDLAVFPGLERLLGEGLHPHEPLLGEVGLDDGAAAVTVPHRVRDGRLGDVEPGGLEIGDDELARLLDFEAAVLRGDRVVQRPVRVQDVDLGEVVALPHLEVVGVVGRRNLDQAGAELAIDVLVGDDRDETVGER